jgi:predicted  nucleic acid-binding Zn-ribbon protein
MMLPEIENLVRLQKVDDEIRALETRLRAIPKEIEALEKEIATERKNLEDAAAALSDAQKAHRANESALAATEEKVKKYRDQLMTVKTNDEYKMMQKQIEVAQVEVSGIEDKILQGYDAIKELEEKKKLRQKELEKGQTEISAMARELESERSRLESELAAHRASRDEILKAVPSDLFGDYERIAKTRGGVAMAEAIDERCQVCMVRLRPQVYQELRIGEKIFHCESCRRILYFQQKEEAAAT